MIILKHTHKKLAHLMTLTLALLLAVPLGACTMNPFLAKPHQVSDLLVPTAGEYLANAKPSLEGAAEFTVAKERGLGDGSGYSEKYMQLQTYYRKALELYLDDILDFTKYEDEFEQHEANFIPTSEERITYYEKYSTLGYEHLYIHNNLYLERLDQADIDLLDAQLATGSSEVTPEVLAMVKRTYGSVIRDMQRCDELVEKGHYYIIGPADTAAMPDSLIIVLNDPIHLDEDSEIAASKMIEREQYSLQRLPQIWKEMQAKIDVPITLFMSDGSNITYAYDKSGAYRDDLSFQE